MMEFMVMLQILHLFVWELRDGLVHIPSEGFPKNWECLVNSSTVWFEFPTTSDPSKAVLGRSELIGLIQSPLFALPLTTTTFSLSLWM